MFYFRLAVPAKSREIIQSLRTQNSDEAERSALMLAAHFKTLLHDLKAGKTQAFCHPELIAGTLSALAS
nr:DUF6538 domain-containing protein [Methylomonas koyamae]